MTIPQFPTGHPHDMLLKPFTAPVDGSGHSVLTITHGLNGLKWKVYQVGFGLGQPGGVPQVAAHVNGQPLMATVLMQPSVFANLPGQPPYAQESFMVGPPYIILKAGDQIVCGVIGAIAGDTFTATAYVEEYDLSEETPMGY